jgi:hypothetical protein
MRHQAQLPTVRRLVQRRAIVALIPVRHAFHSAKIIRFALHFTHRAIVPAVAEQALPDVFAPARSQLSSICSR